MMIKLLLFLGIILSIVKANGWFIIPMPVLVFCWVGSFVCWMIYSKDGWYFVYAPEYWGDNKIYGLDGLAYSNFKHNYKDHWGIERKMGKGYPVIVTHWMPLPNSPKKEQK